ncbi:MAG TPA: hypothetical protein VF766_09545 [Pyrinomonadaceae bacterium]
MSRLYTFAAILFLALHGYASRGASAQSIDRAQLETELSTLRARMKEVEKQFLSPAPEDRAAFASFLQQSGTGIIRLLPREKFDGILQTRGGGAYYSFTRLTHEYGYGSDIELQQGNLSVGFAGADFGLLTMLGDVSLDDLTLEHPTVEYLSNFKTPTKENEARTQKRQLDSGVTVNEVSYKRHLPALVDKTYVLRSINYGEGDILVAFRVVRRETDGSLVILWKTLKKYPVPSLERSNAVAATAAGN